MRKYSFVRTKEEMEPDPEDISIEDAKKFVERIRLDPAFYLKEYLGVEHWWPGMERMLSSIPKAVETRKPLVVGSGHALSKDFTISGCVPLWFLHAYGPSAIVAMTAPSDRQVKKVMWGELTRRYNNRAIKDEFGRLLICELKISENWYAIAFTTKETGGMVGKFQGFHADAVCVITSEAQAIDDTIFEEIDGIMTSNIALQIHLGNPLHTTGKYASMLKDTTNNIIVNLSCLESPNYLAKKEVIPGMCSYEWVEDKRKRWGEDDPRWVSRVLGKVPKTSVNTVISEDLYESCYDKDLFQTIKRGAIGVDPGRFGDDDMVISVFESGYLIDEKVIARCDAVAGSGEIAIMQKKHFPEGGIVIAVDCDGLGGPYLDMAKKMIPDELNIKWLEFHGASTDKDIIGAEFQNARAEAYFNARDMMAAGAISIPKKDEDVWAREEATAVQYFINLRGKMQIEAKEDLKDRLGRSPDRWDSRVLGMWGLKFADPIRKRDRWRDNLKASMIPGGVSSAMGA